MTVTLWRCPSCPVILVGPQIEGAMTHTATHTDRVLADD